MIAFISLVYASFYFIVFDKLGLLKKSAANISAFAGVGVVIIASIVFAWFTFSPMAQDARVFRYVVPIVPNVSGPIVEVDVVGMAPMKHGDVLFRIDPDPFRFTVDRLEATAEQQQAALTLAEINLDRATELFERQAGPKLDVDIWTAERDGAEAALATTAAQLDQARWELEQTVVRAPSDGYATGVAVREGMRVTTIPMAATIAFISTAETEVVASFSQSAIRRLQEGDEVEMVFNGIPGRIFAGTVNRIARASSQAQLEAQGSIVELSGAPVTNRWAVRVLLDDAEVAAQLPQGMAGTMAVYSDAGAPFHIISRVALRMTAWLSYLTSP